MFPITEEYIEREYTIAGNHLMLTSEHTAKIIEQKARKVLGMLKLIQDMFPITEEYIEREYTIAGNHLMLTSEHTAKIIEQKARKVLGMLKRGVKFMPTQPDVLSILEKLKQNK